MRWPLWSRNASDERERDDKEASRPEDRALLDWSYFKDPRTLLSTLILTTASLTAVHVYRLYLRRIPEATNIQTRFFRRRSLLGRVTSVGDGDNFRLFHTPGGRLAGWDWLPGRKVPTKRELLKDRTVCMHLVPPYFN